MKISNCKLYKKCKKYIKGNDYNDVMIIFKDIEDNIEVLNKDDKITYLELQKDNHAFYKTSNQNSKDLNISEKAISTITSVLTVILGLEGIASTLTDKLDIPSLIPAALLIIGIAVLLRLYEFYFKIRYINKIEQHDAILKLIDKKLKLIQDDKDINLYDLYYKKEQEHTG